MLIHNAVITGSLTLNGTDIGDITGSEAAINALNIFSSSIYAYTASNDTTNTTQNNRLSSLEITSGSLLTASGSFSTRVTTLETASGSFSTRVTNTETTASNLTVASSSFSTRVTNNEATGSNLVAASASFSTRTTNLETASGSFSTRVTTNETNISNLQTASGSFSTRVTSAESSIVSLQDATGSYATTGSNNFVNTQRISATNNAIGFTSTASLYTDGGLRVTKDAYVSGTLYLNNLTVYGTQSVQYITASQLNISTNIISVNTDTPSIRYGGLSVYDSGSTGLTGSLLWDSEANHWIYTNPSGSTYSGGMLISGPRASALGSEQGTTACALMMGQGGDHITSSAIFHYGNATCFYGNSRIDSSGNSCQAGYAVVNNCLGIGTASPSVYGVDAYNASNSVYFKAASNATIAYYGAATALGTGVAGTFSNHDLALYTNSTEKARVTSGGDIAIGSSSTRLSGGSTCSTFLTLTAKASGANALLELNGIRTGDGDYSGYVRFFNNSGATPIADIQAIRGSSDTSGTLAIATSGTERMRITAAGIACFACQVCSPAFVGGTVSGTTGTFSSNVTGTSFITDGSTLFGITLKGRAADNFGAIGFYSNNGLTRYGYIQSHSCNNGQLNINADGGAQIIGDCRGLLLQPSSGNVGVGITTPSYKLHVNSSVDGISAGIAGSTYGIRFDNGGTFSSGMSTIHGVDATLVGSYQPIMLNGLDVRFGTSATERMRITSTGIACFACRVCSTGLTSIGDIYFGVGASSYDQVSLCYSGYNGGSPLVTLMPTTVPGSGALTTQLLLKSNGLGGVSGCNHMGLNVQSTTYLATCNGSVGIATINPLEKLEVCGSVKIGNLKIQDADGGRIGFNRNTATGAIYNSNYAAFQINGAYSGTNYLDFQNYSCTGTYLGGFVLNNGSVGIGCTTSPLALLHVAGATTAEGQIITSNSNVYYSSGVNFYTGNTNRGFVGWRYGCSTIPFTLPGIHMINTDNSYIVFGTTNTVRAVINDIGRVGIGTTSPEYLLHIYCCNPLGMKIQTCGSSFGSPSLNLLNGAVDTVLSATSNGLEIGTWSAHNILFKTVQQTRATIFTSGETCFACTVCSPKYVLNGSLAGGSFSVQTFLISAHIESCVANILTLSSFNSYAMAIANIEWGTNYALAGNNMSIGYTIAGTRRGTNDTVWVNSSCTILNYGDSPTSPTFAWNNGVLQATAPGSHGLNALFKITVYQATGTPNI